LARCTPSHPLCIPLRPGRGTIPMSGEVSTTARRDSSRTHLHHDLVAIRRPPRAYVFAVFQDRSGGSGEERQSRCRLYQRRESHLTARSELGEHVPLQPILQSHSSLQDRRVTSVDSAQGLQPSLAGYWEGREWSQAVGLLQLESTWRRERRPASSCLSRPQMPQTSSS
jgi:hypothetical protein